MPLESVTSRSPLTLPLRAELGLALPLPLASRLAIIHRLARGEHDSSINT
jgi:hypothetical protein